MSHLDKIVLMDPFEWKYTSPLKLSSWQTSNHNILGLVYCVFNKLYQSYGVSLNVLRSVVHVVVYPIACFLISSLL